MIWNVGTAAVLTEVSLPEVPWSASWSWNGSSLVVSCRDKKVRIINPRSGDIVHVSGLVVKTELPS